MNHTRKLTKGLIGNHVSCQKCISRNFLGKFSIKITGASKKFSKFSNASIYTVAMTDISVINEFRQIFFSWTKYELILLFFSIKVSDRGIKSMKIPFRLKNTMTYISVIGTRNGWRVFTSYGRHYGQHAKKFEIFSTRFYIISHDIIIFFLPDHRQS